MYATQNIQMKGITELRRDTLRCTCEVTLVKPTVGASTLVLGASCHHHVSDNVAEQSNGHQVDGEMIHVNRMQYLVGIKQSPLVCRWL